MAATFGRPPPNPLMVPELVNHVISFIDRPMDLFRCSMVNSMWTTRALQMLYQGSMNDMRFYTPDLSFLDSLFVQSPEHFAQNVGYIKHMTITTKPGVSCLRAYNVYESETNKIHDILRGRTGAELLLRLKGKNLVSLAILFLQGHEGIPYLRDLILHPDLKFLTIDHEYCSLLRSGLHLGKDQSSPPVGHSRMRLSPLCPLFL